MLYVEKLPLAGLAKIVTPRAFVDPRGSFIEQYRIEELRTALALPSLSFVQSNVSTSGGFVLRGLHYQLDRQAKLFSCLWGFVLQVAVDMRAESPTFGQHVSTPLNPDGTSIFVPPGFANGFMTTQLGAVVGYNMTTVHNEKLERGVRWNDDQLGIKWPIGQGASLTISAKDKAQPLLADATRWTFQRTVNA